MMISVIMPTYNAENTIEKAIYSILNQTLQDFEIIICDDCSTDNTWNILKKISKIDARIKIFRNERNSKSAFTRNFAISKSSGKYIMQLDDDDYCDIYRMEKQTKFLDGNLEYDFVGTNGFLWDDSGIYGEIKLPQKPTKKELVKTSPFLNPSVMFRKEALEKVNGYRISAETNRGQDYDLFLRMYAEGLKGYNIQEKLLYYRKDKKYFNKISWRNRIGEVKFRYRNFKRLGLLPKYLPYVFKPGLAALIPNKILSWNHQRKS